VLKSELGQIELPAEGAVIVCGGGAAGIAAALAAARAGAEVLLLEQSPAIGGTVANALIHTLGGLYDSAGEIINDGLPAELIDRLQRADSRTGRRKLGRAFVLNVCPRVYQSAVSRWLAECPQVRVLTSVRVTGVRRAGDRLVGLVALAGSRSLSLRPRAVIDATGTAAVTRLIDPSLVIDDGPRSAGGWIFRLSNVALGALDFPKGVGLVRDLRAATAAGDLPPLASHAWLDAGVAGDQVYVKLMVPIDDDSLNPEAPAKMSGRTPSLALQASMTQNAIVTYLSRRPDFARAAVTLTGSLGVRDGGRICGRYTLTADDVRQGRKFADAACGCAWPIEYWDAERGVSVEYLPPGVQYDVPLRALQVNGIDNFWVAGKCLSADRWAHASARVAGTCWAMGQAVGQAAAEQSRVGCAHLPSENNWWAQPTLQP